MHRASLPYRDVFQTCITCARIACLTKMSFRPRLFGRLFRKFVKLYGLLYVDVFNSNINIYLLVGHLLLIKIKSDKGAEQLRSCFQARANATCNSLMNFTDSYRHYILSFQLAVLRSQVV